uniref:Uncharacterized protein n=1 Tax=Prymnesium polylepis TaxID=72548 RepID=A0A7S4JAG6_9EUKA
MFSWPRSEAGSRPPQGPSLPPPLRHPTSDSRDTCEQVTRELDTLGHNTPAPPSLSPPLGAARTPPAIITMLLSPLPPPFRRAISSASPPCDTREQDPRKHGTLEHDVSAPRSLSPPLGIAPTPPTILTTPFSPLHSLCWLWHSRASRSRSPYLTRTVSAAVTLSSTQPSPSPPHAIALSSSSFASVASLPSSLH